MAQYNHVKLVDLFNNGVGYEVIIMKEDKNNGDLYFIRTDYLDEIDLNRITSILNRRDARAYPLWDLLSNITLLNGCNALEYFHQFVKMRTLSGEIMAPNPHRSGMGSRRQLLSDAEIAKQQAAISQGENGTRRPGRPPKAAQ